jgi:uncharacterized membrane protein
MTELVELVRILTGLTTALTVLSAVLVALVLVDCAFLYRRMVLFRRKQQNRGTP